MYNHTTTVIANPKIFDRTYQSLIDRIDNEASMIYHMCRTANEDLDNRNREEAMRRIEMQEEAVERCLWLKTDIRLAQKKFHLRASKAAYWTGLVNDALEAIKNWNISEKRKFKEVHGL